MKLASIALTATLAAASVNVHASNNTYTYSNTEYCQLAASNSAESYLVAYSRKLGFEPTSKECEVLLSKNSNAVLPIASITKLMTALVVSEDQFDVLHVRDQGAALAAGELIFPATGCRWADHGQHLAANRVEAFGDVQVVEVGPLVFTLNREDRRYYLTTDNGRRVD